MRAGLLFTWAAGFGLLVSACNSNGNTTATGTTGGSGGSGGSGGTGGTGTGTTTGTGGGSSGPLTIKTDKGSVEGTVLGATRAFLGIPFAAPPVGDLRWKPPAPHAEWADTLKADKKGRPCTQNGAITNKLDSNTGEDCLTLNVWAPDSAAASGLPVMVWIHGGAFVLGSGSDAAYDGHVLSEATNTVVVSINYRLGPFGFLALPELKAENKDHPSTGAYGLEDQRAALEWVKANIAGFGGDPSKVTVFGESAGGISTCMHMVSPQSKGLFQRAIIESGPCDTATPEDKAVAQGASFVEALSCKDAPDVLACIRSKPMDAVMSALPSSTDFFFGGSANWFPVLDGWNLPETPGKLIDAGTFEKVPVIMGTNEDEGSLFLLLAGAMGKVPDEATFKLLAEQLVPGHGDEVVMHYPSANYGGSVQKAATAAVGDAAFVCPTRRTARSFVKNGVSTFLYHFTFVPDGNLLGELGSYHSAEVKYVLGNPSQLTPKALTDDELKLAGAMQGYWSRHADKGDPNGKDALAWPKYDAASDENIVFDLTVSKQTGLKKDLCDFWDAVPVKLP